MLASTVVVGVAEHEFEPMGIDGGQTPVACRAPGQGRGVKARGLRVVGIHSPEYDRERERAAVADKVREFGLRHPVMIDNDFRYWKALGNRFWPAFYLIDKRGLIRHRYIGETREGDVQAETIEAAVIELLTETD